jgi:hypothetical protein
MNSLLQQLYMIPSLRNDILAVDDPKKERIQMRTCFTKLNVSLLL